MKLHKIIPALALLPLSACSTSFWYTQIQAEQYHKCEKLASSEDRRRCKGETYPDKEKYDRDREGTKGASR